VTAELTPKSVSRQIALVTFGILALELATIRWMGHQIRMFAYLNNMLLIAAFLGMGLGIQLGKRRPGLFHWALPSYFVLALILKFSLPLGVMHLRFPDLSVSMWGGEVFGTFGQTLAIVMGLLILVTWSFACAATRLGELFNQLPPLRSYSADLFGSLLGVIAVAIVSAFMTPTPVWLALGCVPLAILSRTARGWVATLGIIGLGMLSIEGARFSPYNRLDFGYLKDHPGQPQALAANRDFHQLLYDFRPGTITDRRVSPDHRVRLQAIEAMYRLPFSFSGEHRRALILGAGTGNDVAAAHRSGFKEVVSVDIDPLILEVGRNRHLERPYQRPGTVAVVNDARAYFEQARGSKFDVVCFGLLDSHAMFSSMSSLRLDNYVYTVEGLRSAWEYVGEDGVMSITFSSAPGTWILERIYNVLREATGQEPAVFSYPRTDAHTFIVGRGRAAERAAQSPDRLRPQVDRNSIRLTTDDWPFLYIRPGIFPSGYLAVLVGMLLVGVVGAYAVFERQIFRRGHFDPALFMMGAAFLLIETRGVTYLSLLFGSTWIVNTAVFAGVLSTALLANFLVQRHPPSSLTPYWCLLTLSLVAMYLLRPGVLLSLPILARGVAGGLLNAAPILFAGVIFSALLSRSPDPAASLASNLLGAIFGGCVEYLSMIVGLRALTLVAITFYLVALMVSRHDRTGPLALPAAPAG